MCICFSVFYVHRDLIFRLDNILETDPQNGTALEQAIKEAVDDETFRKVKRMSYSGGSAGEVSVCFVFGPNILFGF